MIAERIVQQWPAAELTPQQYHRTLMAGVFAEYPPFHGPGIAASHGNQSVPVADISERRETSMGLFRHRFKAGTSAIDNCHMLISQDASKSSKRRYDSIVWLRNPLDIWYSPNQEPLIVYPGNTGTWAYDDPSAPSRAREPFVDMSVEAWVNGAWRGPPTTGTGYFDIDPFVHVVGEERFVFPLHTYSWVGCN